MATRGTESGDQPNISSAFNPGGSWKFEDNVKNRTQVILLILLYG